MLPKSGNGICAFGIAACLCGYNKALPLGSPPGSLTHKAAAANRNLPTALHEKKRHNHEPYTAPPCET